MFTIVYKITNTTNGKVYIGQTINALDIRFKRHINDAMNHILDTHFARAIRKYGKDSFKAEIIDTANTQSELTTKEKFWIDYYDSVNCGYNETNATHKSGGNTYYSKKKEDMVVIRRKISQQKIGGKNPMARKVKCKDTLTGHVRHFESESEMAKFFGESNHQFVSRRCLGYLTCMYKDRWLIAYEEDNFQDNGVRKGEAEKRGRVIRAKNTETGEISIFNSIRSAHRAIGKYFCSRNHMSKIINGTIPQEGKFLLEVLDEGVSTIPDECKGVGREIDTRSKREAIKYKVI